MSTQSTAASASAAAPTAYDQILRVVFHIVAITEAITWAGLLWAMYMRYISDSPLDPVPFWGMAHGVAFIVFCAVVTVVAWHFRWRIWEWILALLLAVPPLTTIPLEVWCARTGRLKPGRERSERFIVILRKRK